MSDDTWEVYALRYATLPGFTRSDSFLFNDDHACLNGMDYFVWLLRSPSRAIVVDTGFGALEAEKRGRKLLHDPVTLLEQLDILAGSVDSVIITHLHYDHAGSLERFPNACFHLQAAEIAYATGPCMCHPILQKPFTVEHVVEMVRCIYSGRVAFHNGSAEIVPGVLVHRIGGHSRGLQSVQVKTGAGWVCLASDATHFYENFLTENPFPIVVDVQDALDGFKIIRALASSAEHTIPGHDPKVCLLFPEILPDIYRLDKQPLKRLDRQGQII
ncbi:N-acyl homoserine lactonase family protein [Rhodosalinus sp. FB01]|uniref:N-acyl homoserine lactonase family protein n=1 Tax=Rhodosalinus sp. FB01 TaxID=3239194 RepID=UPI00352621C9